ncbi:MAG: hypothetical protein HYX71_06845 [Opitutae bacterium]|nr:hypothetical protein [Opitutae bacterium]
MLLVGFHFWGARVAWSSNNPPGGEFRQAQTALSAYFIQQENNFSLAYPTPVLGKPWSVPMEFPLYQWTVVLLSNATGLDLTQAGRTVSLACFYLTLPAIFLLLGHLNLTPVRRLPVLGLILTCPLYIFYARAFLIETMALMFSVWFLLAFIHAVEAGDRRWLVLANLMGIGAGLVKVTTFMLYLIPAGAWGLWILYHSRSTEHNPGWKNFLLFIRWIGSATAVPFAVTLWWLHLADTTKALNPNAEFLLSSNLTGFNFGFAGARLSGAIWHSLWDVLRLNLAWPPVLAACGLGVAVLGRRWWAQFAICLAVYLGAQLLFPQLYAWHDYYSVASGVLLLGALGFGLVALLESRLPRLVVLPLILAVFGGQLGLYAGHLYRSQNNVNLGGSGLTEALHYLTRPDQMIVMATDDWSSITPYYARRRALMIRNGKEHDRTFVTKAFASLQGEPVGAVILSRDNPGFAGIVELAAAELRIDPQPVLEWHGLNVFLNAARRRDTLANLEQTHFHEAVWLADAEPVGNPSATTWIEYARMRPEQRSSFQYMDPQPRRFLSTFGPGLSMIDGRPWLTAHPDTRLRFALPAGPHRLSAEFRMDPGCYAEALAPGDRSDGVGFAVFAIAADGSGRTLFSRHINPAVNIPDRGPLLIEVDFTLEQPGEIELFIGSGPNGSNSRDWALLGPVQID